MDQLWYTWSSAGLGSVTGHRVRAASSRLLNLQDELYHEIEKYLHYVLPDDINPYDITTASSPYSLTYIVTELHGPLLLHRVYAGEDAYGRAGVFFIHVLANLDGITPLDAINTWHSPFWQVSDGLPIEQVSLPDVQRQDIIAGSLSVAAVMRERVNQRYYQQNLETLVQAYLSLEGWQNLYLETCAEDDIHGATERNAELIWGLLHCLPPHLAEQVTFSTYEGKIEAEPAARIIATCFPALERLQREPSHQGFVLKWGYGPDDNLLLRLAEVPSDQASSSSLSTEQLQTCAVYAQYIVAQFLSGNVKDQKIFYNMTLLFHASTVPLLLTLYQWFTTHQFNADDIKNILLPENAVTTLEHDFIREAILSFLVKESRTTWWEDAGKAQWSKLAAKTTTVTDLQPAIVAFAMFLRDVISTELFNGNSHKASIYLPILEIIAPANKQPKIWKQLMEELMPYLQANEQRYPYELLDATVYRTIVINCSPVANISDEALFYWLHVTWIDLKAFCSWEIPKLWKAKAIAYLIRYDRRSIVLDGDLVAIVSDVRVYYELALCVLARDGAAQSAILHLIYLIDRGYGANLSAVKQLLQSCYLNADEIEQIMSRSKLSSIQLDSLFLDHWEYLLQMVPDRVVVHNCVERFLKNGLDVSILKSKGTGAVLNTLYENKQYFPTLQTEIEQWLRIRGTLFIGWEKDARNLVKSKHQLKALAEAIADRGLQMNSVYWDILFQYVTPVILDGEDLDHVLDTIARVSLRPAGTKPIFIKFIENITFYVSKSDKLNNNPEILILYMQYAIASVRYLEKKGRTLSEEEVVFRIFQQLLQHADKKTLDHLDNKRLWSPDDWKMWNAYRDFVHPRGLANLKKTFMKKKETTKIPVTTKDVVSTSSKYRAPVEPRRVALTQQSARTTVATPIAAKSIDVASAGRTIASSSTPRAQRQAAPLEDADLNGSTNPSLRSHKQTISDTQPQSSPFRDDEPVGWYQFPGQEKFFVTSSEFKKVDDLKEIYVIYVEAHNPSPAMRSSKAQGNEIERLRHHKKELKYNRSTIELLAYDLPVIEKLKELGFDFDEVEKELSAMRQTIAKYKPYKEYIINKKKYTEEDLREVISKFLRIYFLDTYLCSMGEKLVFWLGNQHIGIEYGSKNTETEIQENGF